MSDSQEVTDNDLTWLRELAESGRNAPLQMGPYLAAGGAWFSAASGVLALIQLRILTPPQMNFGLIWIVAALGFGATLFALIRRDMARGEMGNNRLINGTWSAAGFGIFTFWVATALMAVRLESGVVMGTISLAVLVIYGILWWMISMLTGAVWMRTLAFLSFASTAPVALATGTQFVWLAYTLALVVCALLPGLYLMRMGGRVV